MVMGDIVEGISIMLIQTSSEFLGVSVNKWMPLCVVLKKKARE
jgi:hypothetical protein